MAFLAAENENRQLEDLEDLADFGRLPERLLLSVKKKSINHRLSFAGLNNLFSGSYGLESLISRKRKILSKIYEQKKYMFIHHISRQQTRMISLWYTLSEQHN